MKKKILKLIIASLAITPCMFFMTACFGGDGNPSHTHTLFSDVVDPTCTTDGYTFSYCQDPDCEFSEQTNIVPSLGGHNFENYTTNFDGTKTAHCENNSINGCTESDTTEDDSGLTAEFEYNYYTDSYSFKKYTGTATEVVVPATYNGKRVLEVESFNGSTIVKRIVISEGIEKVGSAFSGCTALEELVLPSTMNEMSFSLNTCNSLTTLTINEGNPFWHSLGNCIIETSTKRLIKGCAGSVIPEDDSVTTIAEYSFSGNYNITSITIPNNITTIEPRAFNNCRCLQKIVLGTGLESIGAGAFVYCTQLVEVINKSSLELVLDDQNNGRVSMYALQILDSEPAQSNFYQEGDLNFYKLGNDYYFIGHKNGDKITSLILPEKVNGQNYYVKKYILDDSETILETLVIPSNILGVGEYAFKYVRNATFPISVVGDIITSDNDYSFWNITINSGSVIGGMRDCRNLNTVTLPSGVTEISDYAFSGCSSLTSINLPNTIERIGKSAFSDCSSLSQITFPSELKVIDNAAFYYTKLNNVILPNKLTTIENYAFSCCAFTSINIPNSVKYIGVRAFSYSLLTTIILPDELEYISTYTFANSNNFTATEYEGGLYLGNASNPYFVLLSVKEGATSLTVHPNTIYISDGFTVPATCDFISAVAPTLMNEARIESRVMNITSAMVTSIKATNLEELTISSGNTLADDSLYDFDNLKKVVISDSVTTIGSRVLASCSSLEELVLPNTIVSIGEDSFKYSSVKKIEIPIFALSYIPKSRLEVIKLSNGIIPSEAFKDCENLYKVILCDSITAIEEDAFKNCRYLTEIENYSSLNITLGSNDNGEIAKFATIVSNSAIPEAEFITSADFVFYVNNGNYYLFKYTGESREIILPETIDGHSYILRQNCLENFHFKSIVLPKTIISIDEYAFRWYDWSGCYAYFTGTKQEKEELIGDAYLVILSDASKTTWYYYSETQPAAEGNYWHYIDGIATAW